MAQTQTVACMRGEILCHPVTGEMAAHCGVDLPCLDPGTEQRLAGFERSHAKFIQLVLPRRGFIAHHERVREVSPVAVDDDREVEEEQIAAADHAAARWAAPLDRAPGARDEISIDQYLLPQCSRRRRRDQQISVQLGHPGLDLGHRGGMRGFPARTDSRMIASSSASLVRRSVRIR